MIYNISFCGNKTSQFFSLLSARTTEEDSGLCYDSWFNDGIPVCRLIHPYHMNKINVHCSVQPKILDSFQV